MAATPPTSIVFFLLLLLLLSPSAALTFKNPRFDQDNSSILCSGGATASSGTIKLTNSHYGIEVSRVLYNGEIPLWDSTTGKLSDFSTHFSFSISSDNTRYYPSGIAFFLAPVGFYTPENSAGGYMGLYNYTDRVHPPPGKRIVHVEFDYFVNPAWDPPYQHVEINNNSLSSAVFEQWISDPHPGHPILVEINYSSSTHNLTVSWEYGNSRTWSPWYVIDLRKALPELVIMGFSATCNDFSGEQELLSWDFTSDLEMRESSFPKKKLMGIVGYCCVNSSH